jgi:hypothetical protein
MAINYAQATTDLVSLVERFASVSLTKRANHHIFGDEYWGNCPFCGTGTDRFHVWPQSERPHYWCRVCGAEGSPAQFLMKYAQMSFGQALDLLGLSREAAMTPAPPRPIQPGQPPCKEWQQMARWIVERAEAYLWHPNSQEGQRALAYLRGRGLTDETIHMAHLGYIPIQKDGKWHQSPLSHWGIDPDLVDEKRRKLGMRIPDGIVIPWFDDDAQTIWTLAVKRPFRAQGDTFEYGHVFGSGKGLYLAETVQPLWPVMMVEGEFDALSVWQEARDLLAVVATGGTNGGRVLYWQGYLRPVDRLLQSFDADEGGEAGAAYWLAKHPQARRWRPDRVGPYKDANDLLRAGEGMVRSWVQDGLAMFDARQTPADVRSEQTVPVQDEGEDEGELCAACLDMGEETLATVYHPPAELDDETLPPLCYCDAHDTMQGRGSISLRTGQPTAAVAASVPAKPGAKPAPVKKESIPPWLVPGSWDWRRQVQRQGLAEMERQRREWLAEHRRPFDLV